MLLKKKGSGGDINTDEEWIEYETDNGYGGKTVFVRNPFYTQGDPMKAVYWEYENENGKKTRVRNPFAPPASNFVTKIGNAFVVGKGQVFYMPETDPVFK